TRFSRDWSSDVCSSDLDFAYAIHSEVGNHCSGARANGQIVPLRYKLKSGDVMEIMTAPAHKPNKDWLDFCATSRARTRIRSYVRSEERRVGKECRDRRT